MDELITSDITDTLRNHYGFGEESIKQFLALENDAIIEAVYREITIVLADKATAYENTIGEIEL